ncbi:hypothetical protein [Peterkaempfera griseoplana]|uniref:hypothetical protein n=1 Tax=Peterkaempfera griseoplana TaxID=66896 RepID=UPI0006E18E09|nr:hypothetical protein [Peterkaempfera griseoplana]
MPSRPCGCTPAGAGRHEEAVTEHLRTLVFLDQAGERIEPHIADFARVNLRMAIGSAHTALKNWFQAADESHSAVDLCRTGRRRGVALVSPRRRPDGRRTR